MIVSEQEGDVTIQFNLFILRRQLEIAKGTELTWDQIARQAGVHPNTLYSLASNKSKGITLATMEALVAFFRSQGMEINPGDLFTMRVAEDREGR
jgi:DNA-binding Xre family transcriptional regulator